MDKLTYNLFDVVLSEQINPIESGKLKFLKSKLKEVDTSNSAKGVIKVLKKVIKSQSKAQSLLTSLYELGGIDLKFAAKIAKEFPQIFDEAISVNSFTKEPSTLNHKRVINALERIQRELRYDMLNKVPLDTITFDTMDYCIKYHNELNRIMKVIDNGVQPDHSEYVSKRLHTLGEAFGHDSQLRRTVLNSAEFKRLYDNAYEFNEEALHIDLSSLPALLSYISGSKSIKNKVDTLTNYKTLVVNLRDGSQEITAEELLDWVKAVYKDTVRFINDTYIISNQIDRAF